MTRPLKTSCSDAGWPYAGRVRRGGSEAGLIPVCGGRRHGSSRASLFGQVRLLCGFCCCLRLL